MIIDRMDRARALADRLNGLINADLGYRRGFEQLLDPTATIRVTRHFGNMPFWMPTLVGDYADELALLMSPDHLDDGRCSDCGQAVHEGWCVSAAEQAYDDRMQAIIDLMVVEMSDRLADEDGRPHDAWLIDALLDLDLTPIEELQALIAGTDREEGPAAR